MDWTPLRDFLVSWTVGAVLVLSSVGIGFLSFALFYQITHSALAFYFGGIGGGIAAFYVLSYILYGRQGDGRTT